MRPLSSLLLTLFSAALCAQNINISHRSTLTYTNQTLANVWGYASGGNEYALVGAKNGLSIVDVTNPDNPDEIIQISGPTSSWREIKTYQHYAYVVSEGGGGVQIIDLANLPGTNLSWHSYKGNGPINNLLSNIHALHVDVTKGYLYLYGANPNPYGGKAVVLNLNADPYNPTYAGYFNSNFSGNGNYIHDGFVDNDIMYGAHVYGGFFSIVNMSNKSNPVLVTTQQTPGLFTHNTWRSGSTLFTTDEVSNSYLTSYDISNPNNIIQLDKIQSNPGSGVIVHNTYILNDYAITSWYKDGLTIVDVLRPANMVQVGNYDTYPTGSGNGFNGCWGVYPYLPSGNILASNISGTGSSDGELWVLTPDYVRGCYVEGTITNGSNGQPLSGVLVKLTGTNTSETSNSIGQYKMGQLQEGSFTAQISKTGFVTKNIGVSLSSGVLTLLDVTLLPVGFPVEMTEFTAVAEGRDALLQWATASEINNAGFEVQHGVRTTDWEIKGFVPGKGDTDVPATYEFRVPDLSPGTHFFRLRQMDADGGSSFTDVRSLAIRGKP
ncbi:MAG TPA: choice-of-anchor B family protein, partial [Saprospiraceae bacterium]|nr:choice-of-anchor B family protein [Saprospiraceae bacterium]